jgi:hypothetical protein
MLVPFRRLVTGPRTDKEDTDTFWYTDGKPVENYLIENIPAAPMTASTKPPDLVIHAKVYALAEKYFIHCLKALALQKFETAALTECTAGEFLQAAREAYASTADSDRGMRDAVVASLSKHPEILDHESVKEVLGEVNMLRLTFWSICGRSVSGFES